MGHWLLNGTRFLDKVTDWWIEWSYFQISTSQRVLSAQRMISVWWVADGWPRKAVIGGCLKCLDVLTRSWARLSRRRELNLNVIVSYCSWQHRNNHSSGEKAHYTSSKYTPWEDLNICRLIFIHEQHNFKRAICSVCHEPPCSRLCVVAWSHLQ